MLLCVVLSSKFYVALTSFFFFNDTATTEIYTLSLHDALPILHGKRVVRRACVGPDVEELRIAYGLLQAGEAANVYKARSEEHTSELQSRQYLVCRLLLEKKKKTHKIRCIITTL